MTNRWSPSVADVTLFLPMLVAVTLVWWSMNPSTSASLAYVAIVEALLFLFCFRMLRHNIPSNLLKTSERNCYRYDGSRSERRAEHERWAKSKLNVDYLAAVIAAFMVANGSAVFVGWAIRVLADDVAVSDRILIFCLMVLFGGAAIFHALSFGVSRALADFAAGIQRRKRVYADRDITRIQESYEDRHAVNG